MKEELKLILGAVVSFYIAAIFVSIYIYIDRNSLHGLITFFMPIMLTLVFWLLRSSNRQYDKMQKENEEYYQKMQSGIEKH